MMSKTAMYRMLPLMAFILLLLLLTRGLFLQPQAVPSVKLDKTVPNFELPSLTDGKQVNQSILRGGWTILNVWASWCEACAIEHPFLVKLHNKGYKLIGLNYKDNNKNAKAWLANYGNPYKDVLSDQSGDVAIDFGVYGSPETFLIDKHGFIRYRYVGILTKKVWKQSFLPLIEEKKI